MSRCMVSCGHPSSLGVPEPNPHLRSEPGTPLDRCQNMKLQQRRHKKILLGPSAVAGWGAFVCGGAAAGELLGEYTGELVNDQEAEARGRVYDANNKSFLFQLNDQVRRQPIWSGPNHGTKTCEISCSSSGCGSNRPMNQSVLEANGVPTVR
jgi:hypothetical protein